MVVFGDLALEFDEMKSLLFGDFVKTQVQVRFICEIQRCIVKRNHNPKANP